MHRIISSETVVRILTKKRYIKLSLSEQYHLKEKKKDWFIV